MVIVIAVGVEFKLGGRLNVASDGSQGKGKSFSDYKVRIVKILGNGAKYPILLGDENTN